MRLAGQQIPAGPRYATVLPDLDFEAYSEAGYYWDGPADRWRSVERNKSGLASVGMAVYSEHPSTEILSLAYDLKDGHGPSLWLPGMPPPAGLFIHIAKGGLLEAFNSNAEYQLWRNVCTARMGWPELPLEQLRCCMAKGRAWSVPGSLEKVGAILGTVEQKDKAGAALIRKFCIPRSPTKKDRRLRNRPEDYPEDFKLFTEGYNVQDIKAEAAISERVPDLTPRELELWLLDQGINMRGVHIDKGALDACIAIINQAHTRYILELRELTDHFVQTADELQKLKNWLSYRGVYTDSVDADAVEGLLKDQTIPADARRVLEIRASLGARSIKKLFSINNRLSADGRLRGLFAFCGADRTGRFAGRGPQPQNLPNSGPAWVRCSCGAIYAEAVVLCPVCGLVHAPGSAREWGPEAIDAALRVIATRDLDAVERYWGDAVAVISGCLRGLFCAPEGKDLLCSDYSSIEAVVLAILAGEEWRLEVFRTHGKIYEMSAAAITGVPFEEFLEHKKRTGEHHPLRKKIGKVAELASGYCGWIGAWRNFGAGKYFNDDEIKKNILAWRKASPLIEELWGGQWRKDPNRWHWTPELFGLEGAAIQAIQNPGRAYTYRLISYEVKDDVLYCKLPSGRLLSYHRPRLSPGMAPHGNPILDISYEGWNSDYKKGPIGWMRLDTYGGKLTENATQATARDILTYAMPKLEAAGYPIVLHVHDETVSEVPAGSGSIAEYEAIMMDLPEWAADWPIKASGGWRGKRYRK